MYIFLGSQNLYLMLEVMLDMVKDHDYILLSNLLIFLSVGVVFHVNLYILQYYR